MPAENGRPELALVTARMRVIDSLRRGLATAGYREVQTPTLHRRLSGFEKGTGFSTYSASLGEHLWLRAAPELYLKRLLIEWASEGADRLFELAICLRDDFDEMAPLESFDRPEVTLLELYATEDDEGSLETLLRVLVEGAVTDLAGDPLTAGVIHQANVASLKGEWPRRSLGELLRESDGSFDLEALLEQSWSRLQSSGDDPVEAHAAAIEARARDAELRDGAADLAYRSGNITPYLRMGPQGYWYDLVEHAFKAKAAPQLQGPTIIEGFPLESSPLAHSDDGIHARKWELYMGGLRVALAQRELMDAAAQTVRFEHLDRLRRLGYDLLPEPDESFLADLERWPAERPVIGMGVYIDRLAGYILGLLEDDRLGQERMLPNLFKGS